MELVQGDDGRWYLSDNAPAVIDLPAALNSGWIPAPSRHWPGMLELDRDRRLVTRKGA